jgi:hypothetical protein
MRLSETFSSLPVRRCAITEMRNQRVAETRAEPPDLRICNQRIKAPMTRVRAAEKLDRRMGAHMIAQQVINLVNAQVGAIQPRGWCCAFTAAVLLFAPTWQRGAAKWLLY